MAPSSYGLQPWHVFVVSNPEVKKKMQLAAFMQAQIVDVSHILVFCGRNDVMERIDEYGNLQAKKSILDTVKIKGVQTFMKGAMAGKSKEHLMNWGKRQAYIALGFALAACCELKIDSCPMEGFDSKKMDEILHLPSYMNSAVILAVGYRKADSIHPKVRYSKDDLFTFI